MRYSEVPPPPGYHQLIKLGWTLELDGDPTATVRHVATPAGCVEIIHPLRGPSFWPREQPERFVAGVIRQPAELRLGGNGHFIGVRLWPWAWNRIAGMPASRFVDDWRDLGEAAPQLRTSSDAEGATAAVAAELGAPDDDALFDAILHSASVSEVAQRSGRSPRWLQRWFEREIGLPPRTYLRL